MPIYTMTEYTADRIETGIRYASRGKMVASVLVEVVLFALWFGTLGNSRSQTEFGVFGILAVAPLALLLYEIFVEPKTNARIHPLLGARETAIFFEDHAELTTDTLKGQQVFTVRYEDVKRFGVIGTTLVMVVDKKRNIVVDLMSTPEAHELPSLLGKHISQ